MESRWTSVEHRGAHKARGAPRGVGVPPTLVDRWWAPGLDSFANIFNIFQK